MIVQDIINTISEQTRDVDNITWTESDIFGYINEAYKIIIQAKPEASVKKENVSCVIGILQSLPDDSVSLINVLHNDDGTVINEVDVTQKDAFSPGWRNATPGTIVKEFFRRAEPTDFEVWPPLSEVKDIMVEYSFIPVDVTAVGDTIAIHNSVNDQFINYCLYKTFARDSEDTPSVKRAALYLQLAKV